MSAGAWPRPAVLPANPDAGGFDALHDDIPRWRGAIEALAARYADAPVTPMSAGTVLVALVGSALVIKLYPPFLRDHFAFEAAMLPRLEGRLGVPTPQLRDQGELDGWPFLVMSQLGGEPLDRHWPTLDEATRCRLLSAIGRLAAEVHALPVDDTMASLAPHWGDFIARQRAGCRQRQQRTGLPAHLLDRLDAILAGPLPAGRPALLTGEYTPMNLLVRDGALSGLFDFGDGLVGPAAYDWLGPLCFLAAGSRERVDAYFEGYGLPAGDRSWRLPLLRQLLLHRYSNLRAQLAIPDWQQAPSFEALAERLWP